MRFLIDANLPRSTAQTIADAGHEAVDCRDVGLRSAPDRDIAAYALVQGLVILTRDFDFADIRNYPPQDYAGIVVIELPDDAPIAAILALVVSFVSQSELLSRLRGRLAIVEPGRVRFRPA